MKINVGSAGEFEVQIGTRIHTCTIDVVPTWRNTPMLQLYDESGPRLAVSYDDLTCCEIPCDSLLALRGVIIDAIRENWFYRCNISEVIISPEWLKSIYNKWVTLMPSEGGKE